MKQRKPKEVHCHKLVWATAVEMAGELYDLAMRDNRVYARWKAVCPELTPVVAEIKFIELLAPQMIADARTTLAGMLGRPDVPEKQKELIYDALIRDATLQRGRGVTHHSVGLH